MKRSKCIKNKNLTIINDSNTIILVRLFIFVKKLSKELKTNT